MKFLYSIFSPKVCPRCSSHVTRRSHRKGPIELMLHWLLFLSPYWCHDCGQRYFGFRFGHHHYSPPTHPTDSFARLGPLFT